MIALILQALSALSIAVYVLAARIPRATVSPIIISPGASSQWTLGGVETIKWLSNEDVSGLNGTIYMGYIQPDGNTFLWKNQPLAEDVALADGAVNIRCPLNLPTGRRYIISLSIDGDDSDISAVFSVIDRSTEATTISPPPTLSTTGNVPPATITRTSVVSTIGAPTDSASSVAIYTTTSSETSAATQPPSPTQSDGGSNGARSMSKIGVGVLPAIFLAAYGCTAGYIF